jgi:elongation factor P
VEVGFVAGRNLQCGTFDFGKAVRLEVPAKSRFYAVAGQQEWPAVGMSFGRPPGRNGYHAAPVPVVASWRGRPWLLSPRANSATAAPRLRTCVWVPFCIKEFRVVSVIASNVRKGNIIEKNGELYVVLTAENFHPGKGTPTTQIEMRRIRDGVKVNERYKTTDGLEKAFVDMRKNNFLYQDGDAYVFMDPDNFDQIHVSADILGDMAVYLQENMEVTLSTHNGVPIAIELPSRVILEIADTEPVVKGQTASSSFKPAKLSNGVKTAVPPHINVGTRVVINTEDGSYVERAKEQN